MRLPTVYNNEQELLRAIMVLHCPAGFQLDPTYSKGHFYLDIPQPIYKFDLNPQTPDTIRGDATQLPLGDNTIYSMILDPPFCFGVHGKTKNNISAKRFTILDTFADFEILYRGILREAKRILQRKGILVFKCQDYTDSKTTMSHCYVWKWATEIGFYAKDLAILVNNNRIYNPNLTQRHLRKTHSYFWIFEK